MTDAFIHEGIPASASRCEFTHMLSDHEMRLSALERDYLRPIGDFRRLAKSSVVINCISDDHPSLTYRRREI